MKVGFNSIPLSKNAGVHSAAVVRGIPSRLVFRVSGGTKSQTTYLEDWTESKINEWLEVYKTGKVEFIYVVNFNEDAERQYKVIQKFRAAGIEFSYIGMGNEHYANKYVKGDTDKKEVTERTANMTAYKYLNMVEEYVKVFGDCKYLITLAPNRKPIHYYWNEAVMNKVRQTSNWHFDLHVYTGVSLKSPAFELVEQLARGEKILAISEFGILEEGITMTSMVRSEKALTEKLVLMVGERDILLNHVWRKQDGNIHNVIDKNGRTAKGNVVIDAFTGNNPKLMELIGIIAVFALLYSFADAWHDEKVIRQEKRWHAVDAGIKTMVAFFIGYLAFGFTWHGLLTGFIILGIRWFTFDFFLNRLMEWGNNKRKGTIDEVPGWIRLILLAIVVILFFLTGCNRPVENKPAVDNDSLVDVMQKSSIIGGAFNPRNKIKVWQIFATDEDCGTVLKYRIEWQENDLFIVHPTGGGIYVECQDYLEFTEKEFHKVKVSASDGELRAFQLLKIPGNVNEKKGRLDEV